MPLGPVAQALRHPHGMTTEAPAPGTAHGLTAVLCVLVAVLLIGSMPWMLSMPLGWLALQIVMAIVFLVAARYHVRRARRASAADGEDQP